MKLAAGALNYALFVGVITAILCFLMIQLVFFNRQLFYQLDKQERVLDNSLSGIAYGLANDPLYDQWVDLFEEDQDSVKVKTQYLGLFKLVTSTAKEGSFSKSRAALFGFKSAKYASRALVLEDQKGPLKLAGEALIKGDAYLSPKGCESAYIEGKNYSRAQHIYGKQQLAGRQLPEVDQVAVKRAFLRLKQEAVQGDTLLPYAALVERAKQAFWSSTLVASEKGKLRIGEMLNGNIVVKASKRITVLKEAQLENVCLVAPEIVIESGFKGKLHLIASDSIIQKPGSRLLYPSSAILLCKNTVNEGQIRLYEQTVFEGLIYYNSSTKRPKNIAHVRVDEGAVVNGQVYANKNVMLRGSINGSLIATSLILITQSGIYQNHLLDGKVDRTKLIEDFAGLFMRGEKGQPELIQWL
jgi:cytoskeletal protein CcmA (bactofilin family)